MGRSYGMPEIDDDELEAELDALGDEIGLDEDSSYLDDAVSTPSVPTSEPGAESTRVSLLFYMRLFCHMLKFQVFRKAGPAFLLFSWH